jgi:hypothetical protein
LFAVLAIFVFRGSRVATVLALILYVTESLHRHLATTSIGTAGKSLEQITAELTSRK